MNSNKFEEIYPMFCFQNKPYKQIDLEVNKVWINPKNGNINIGFFQPNDNYRPLYTHEVIENTDIRSRWILEMVDLGKENQILSTLLA